MSNVPSQTPNGTLKATKTNAAGKKQSELVLTIESQLATARQEAKRRV